MAGAASGRENPRWGGAARIPEKLEVGNDWED